MNLRASRQMIVSALLFLATLNSIGHAETVYPAGSGVVSKYDLSDTLLDISGTLILTRTIVNNESFPLSGLYLSDNFPTEFSLIAHTVTINGATAQSSLVGPVNGEVLAGFDNYRWMVDQPENQGGPHDTLFPGDSLSAKMEIACSTVGAYLLPFHTAVFYGDATGMFSTSDTISLRVESSVDVGDWPEGQNLPKKVLTSYGFPNPFNSSVTVYYEGRNLAGGEISLEIHNLLGQVVYMNTFSSKLNTGRVTWTPTTGAGSGVYFYRLRTRGISHSGRVVLVK